MLPKYPLKVTDGNITADAKIITVPEGSIGQNGAVNLAAAAFKALRFTAENNTHVSHGAFWLPGVDYSSFYWDCLVRPMMPSGTGYIVSAGYGGAHDLLLGTTSGNGLWAVTGNIWDGDSTVSFSSPERFPLGEWYHIAIIWDLTDIMVYVNGVCEGVTTYEAMTRSTPASTDSTLYVGGSDHLMGTFDLAWLRGFEGTLPLTISSYAPFKVPSFPLVSFNNSTDEIIAAQFCADYTVPAGVIADHSAGLSGVLHPGIRSRGATLGGFLGSYPAVILSVDEDVLPQWVDADIAAPTPASSVVIPDDAVIYDSFQTRNNPPFWSNDLGLGNAERGGTWENGSTFGISSGAVFASTTTETTFPVLDRGSLTQDIRMSRLGQRIKLIGRYADADNYIQALFYSNTGTSALELTKVVGGNSTQLFLGNVGSFDADLRMTISGTTVTVYMGGAQVTQQTSSPLPTGTKVGFNVVSTYRSKVTLFECY